MTGQRQTGGSDGGGRGGGGALAGKRVALLASEGVEEVELAEPKRALEQAGAETHLISLKGGTIRAKKKDQGGSTFNVDRTTADAKSADYAALVIAGGSANVARLRGDRNAVQLVREFMESDKPVAAICHGPLMLIEADAVRGRTLTSAASVQTDIRNAGGEWVDKAVAVDQQLITSRKPEDLPQFCAKLVAAFGSAIAESRLDQMGAQSFPASDPLPSPTTIGGETAGPS